MSVRDTIEAAWEGRAAHFMRNVRNDVATPLAADEFA